MVICFCLSPCGNLGALLFVRAYLCLRLAFKVIRCQRNSFFLCDKALKEQYAYLHRQQNKGKGMKSDGCELIQPRDYGVYTALSEPSRMQHGKESQRT